MKFSYSIYRFINIHCFILLDTHYPNDFNDKVWHMCMVTLKWDLKSLLNRPFFAAKFDTAVIYEANTALAESQ